MKNLSISNFIDSNYREYCQYVISSRAIPSLRDGMKPVQRRILWIAKDEAKDYTKVSTLAGAAMRIHPHGNTSIEGAIGTLTQDFCGANNHTLFDGKGSFGGKILGPGKGIGAARYVSVKLNNFTKKVIFKDSELINEIPSYDGEYTECDNFLPLIPMVLVNGINGIAVGFATEIQPYNVKEVIEHQITMLKGKDLDLPLVPYYKGFNGTISWDTEAKKYITTGVFKKEDEFLRITELPIGYNRESYIKVLDKLIEADKIKDYDDYSKSEYDFRIYPKVRKYFRELSDSDIVTMFKLTSSLSQNLTIIDTNNKLKVYDSIYQIIEEFTNWRFRYFEERFRYLRSKLENETEWKKEQLNFILFVLKEDFLKVMTKKSSKEIKALLKDKFKNIDELLRMSVSTFSEESITKLKEQIKENLLTCKLYSDIIDSKDKQKAIYIKELEELKKEI